MRNGNITSKFALTVPTVYIDPVICLTPDGEIDKDVVKVIADLWRNYDVNVRYLHVVKSLETEDVLDTLSIFRQNNPYNFKVEIVHEFDLLKHISPESVAVFFGERDKIPVNHKVYGKEQLLNEYQTLLSGRHYSVTLKNKPQRYRRRRGE
jgi:hypothetical protein